jgi:minor extracellular serine protease Vpr
MPPRHSDLCRRRVTALGVVALVALALGVVAPVGGAPGPVLRSAISAWKSAFGERPQAPVGQRMIVVLEAPALADRIASSQGDPTAGDLRRWLAEAQTAQRLLVTRLERRGVALKSVRSFTRTLNGFSAAVDSRALAELERTDGVVGVYPVRTVQPASVVSETLQRADFRAGGHRPGISLPGFTGNGATIALLDTGVQAKQPALGGRVLPGIDVLGRGKSAAPRTKPDEPGRLETHGTRMAGLLVGDSKDARGVAPGAVLLPIRILGWQRAAGGDYAVFGQSDVLLEGLERAVDPNADGDLADAADIALLPVVEPFAAFADGPEARAVAGATRLGTLVVAAAGNDGRAGRRGFGSVGAPGGAPEALTVGALDARRRIAVTRLVVRAGDETLLDRSIELAGAVVPSARTSLPVAGLRGPTLADPTRPALAGAAGVELGDFFDPDGVSTVAGRAVLLLASGNVAAQARNAAAAGATAVLLSGGLVPAGALDLDEAVAIPVVAVPAEPGRAGLRALAAQEALTVELGPALTSANPEAGRVAPFSSGGLVLDGRVKPDVVAPGVGIVTTDAGVGERVATVSGTSAAAAIVAGAAALVSEARPGLTPGELRSLLVGAARPLDGEPVTAAGAGLVDPAAAAATEIAVEPTTIPLGRVSSKPWRVLRGVAVRNLSSRRVEVSFGLVRESAAPDVDFAANPGALSLEPGARALVTLQASARGGASGATGGAFVVQPVGSQAVRVPWAVSFRPPKAEPLIGDVRLSNRAFEPSSAAPAVVAFRAGRADSTAEGETVEPVALLTAELRRANGKPLGTLIRMRNLLPGRYAFGLTGRSAAGKRLAPGAYVLRLRAKPVAGDVGAADSVVDVRFRIMAAR